MCADHQAAIDHGAVAGLLVYAAKVAVTEWDQLGGRGGDYCLDSVARTVEDTLAALVAHDTDRARRLVGSQTRRSGRCACEATVSAARGLVAQPAACAGEAAMSLERVIRELLVFKG